MRGRFAFIRKVDRTRFYYLTALFLPRMSEKNDSRGIDVIMYDGPTVAGCIHVDPRYIVMNNITPKSHHRLAQAECILGAVKRITVVKQKNSERLGNANYRLQRESYRHILIILFVGKGSKRQRTIS
jgi:hypothetical protein